MNQKTTNIHSWWLMLLLMCLLINGCGGEEKKELKELPIKVSVRTSDLGNQFGDVVRLSNHSDLQLGIRIILENPTTKASKEFYLHIPPYTIYEIGWVQGWKFLSGDTVQLKCDGYKTTTIKL